MLYKVADILCEIALILLNVANIFFKHTVILFNMLFKVSHTIFYGRASLVNMSFDRF